MRRRLRVSALLVLLLVAGRHAAVAQPAPPGLTAPVNDFAHAIDPASAQELDRLIRVLDSATGDVVAVATVPTFQPYGDIKSYAVKMFENGGAGIGRPDKNGVRRDNGVLIVVAIEDRKVAIEVGYGLEEYITDGFAGETIREEILPAFRSGGYGQGLVAGTTRIVNRIAEARGVSLQGVPQGGGSTAAPSVQIPFRGIIIALFIILMMTRGRRRPRGRYWGGGPWSGWSSGVGPFGGGFGGGFGGFGGGGRGGGGGGGGSFGGFGGGRSGGGGASGGW